MSNIWYNIIISLCKQCQTFCSLFNYNINVARSLTIVIIYNKTKWKHGMTKTTFRWPNKWCVELSLWCHRNIFHIATIFSWCGNRNFMNHQKYYVHVVITFYKRIFLFMKLGSHVHNSHPHVRHSHSWAHTIVMLL